MEPLGIIYGNVGTTDFRFAVSDPNVKRNEYVEVEHSECGSVLGQISDISRETDLSFDKAQKLSIGEEVAIGEQLSALVNVLGFRDDRNTLLIPRKPFEAGTKVYKASEKIIRDVLGLKENIDTGAYIGKLKGHKEIKIYLDINSLVQKHAAILAKTGGGKSYILGVLVEELLKKGVPFVVIDPHGEYSSLMHPNNNPKDLAFMERFEIEPEGFADLVVEFSPDTKINKNAIPLKFDEVNLEAKDIMDLIDAKKKGTQFGVLRRAVKNLLEERKFYTLKDVISIIKKDRNPSKWNLINSIDHLLTTGIFGEPPTKINDLVKENQGTIINLRGISPEIQEMVVSRIAKKLFLARKIDRIPPMMLVVEEAHNFCPQQGSAMTLGTLKTIASEGRKFGLGLTVVSQRAAKIDKNVLSQCGTQIILKITNPNDLKAISQSIEGLTHGMEENIQRLPIGSSIVTGGNISSPIIIETRVRHSKHGGASVSIISPSSKSRRIPIEEVVDKMKNSHPERGDDAEDIELSGELDEVEEEEEMKEDLIQSGTLKKIEKEVDPTDVMAEEEPTDEEIEKEEERMEKKIQKSDTVEEIQKVSGESGIAEEAEEADGNGSGAGTIEDTSGEYEDEGYLPGYEKSGEEE